MAKKYYAVQRGRVPGIYATWSDCEKQVKGFSGAVYKSFTSESEAQVFMGHGRTPVAQMSNLETVQHIGGAEKIPAQQSTGVEQRVVIEQNSGAELVAYIDGSFDKRLGTVGAGGIMFFNGVEKTFSFGTKDPQFTEFWNVAGELLAAMHVMQYAVDNSISSCALYYDYMGIEMWATKKWKRNNGLTRGYAEFYDTVAPKLQVHFHKVEAHTGVQYNEVADQLAKAGTKKT